ncbi:hypothetical protein POM88_004202 [Heracleum sosnowskyi]|uniref:Apple domain-containing protein n=1 Tax=Heracleum sosnowskyi TaxID=360622 RepID=A0AAD8ND46_9APIA|nr:hypothetical protein POM88_004202 [Heracleum sosnowskyi]
MVYKSFDYPGPGNFRILQLGTTWIAGEQMWHTGHSGGSSSNEEARSWATFWSLLMMMQSQNALRRGRSCTPVGKSCNYTTYASADVNMGGRGCFAWFGELNDVKKYHSVDGQDFYLRLDAAKLVTSGTSIRTPEANCQGTTNNTYDNSVQGVKRRGCGPSINTILHVKMSFPMLEQVDISCCQENRSLEIFSLFSVTIAQEPFVETSICESFPKSRSDGIHSLDSPGLRRKSSSIKGRTHDNVVTDQPVPVKLDTAE